MLKRGPRKRIEMTKKACSPQILGSLEMTENFLAHSLSPGTKYLIRLSALELMNNHNSRIRSLMIYQLMNHFMKLSTLTLTDKGFAPSKATSLFRQVIRHKSNTIRILCLLIKPHATSVPKKL